eukprot:scaffold266876_cov17-Prasinocladus_malaysianus.AAC.1
MPSWVRCSQVRPTHVWPMHSVEQLMSNAQFRQMAIESVFGLAYILACEALCYLWHLPAQCINGVHKSQSPRYS